MPGAMGATGAMITPHDPAAGVQMTRATTARRAAVAALILACAMPGTARASARQLVPAAGQTTSSARQTSSAGQTSSAAGQTTSPAGQTTAPPPRVLVMPFEASDTSPRGYWLGEGAAILVTEALRSEGAAVISREQRVRTFEEMHLPARGELTRATIIRAAQILGASFVVFGDVTLGADDIGVRSRALRLDTGQFLKDAQEHGPVKDLAATTSRVGRTLAATMAVAGTVGVRTIAPASSQPSLEAFEAYVKGLLAESADAQARGLEAALERFPGYDRALIALWEVETERGDIEAALDAVRRVESSSPRYDDAKFREALSLIELKRNDEAFETLRKLADSQPRATVFNNLGIVQLRRGAVAAQGGTAIFYLTRAAELDADDQDLFFNLGYAYLLDGQPQGAVYWLREAVRREPADADAHYVLSLALRKFGATGEADRERELALKLSSKYQNWEARGTATPRGLERLEPDLQPVRVARFDKAVTRAAEQDLKTLTSFYYDRGRRLYDEQKHADAMGEVQRALYLSPYDAQALVLLGRIHLRAGRATDAVDILRVAVWSEPSGVAHAVLGLALAELGDADAARTELERARALDPNAADVKALEARLAAPTPKP